VNAVFVQWSDHETLGSQLLQGGRSITVAARMVYTNYENAIVLLRIPGNFDRPHKFLPHELG